MISIRSFSLAVAMNVAVVVACRFPEPLDIDDGGNVTGFSVSATLPTFLRVGASVDLEISLTRASRFSQPVTIEARNLPPGLTATSFTLGGTESLGRITLTAAMDAQPGDTSLMVVGTAGDLERSVPVDLVVAGTPGSLDSTFGSGGALELPPALSDVGYAQFVQVADGAWALCGTMRAGDFFVARFARNGSLDARFGSGGVIRFGTAMGISSGVCTEQHGDFLLAGHVVHQTPLSSAVAIGRVRADGTVDDTLGAGTGAAIIANSPNLWQTRAIAVDSLGRILVRGLLDLNTDQYQLAIVRLRPDGALDQGFGTRGTTLTATSDKKNDGPLLVRTDGRILLSSRSLSGSDAEALIILRDDGSTLERVLMVGSGTSSNTTVGGLHLRQDDSVLAVGGTSRGAAVWRIVGETLDSSFGQNGVVEHDPNVSYGEYTTLLAGEANRLVVVGGTVEMEPKLMAVWINADTGTVEESIATRGRVVFPYTGYVHDAFSTNDGRATVLQLVPLPSGTDRTYRIVRFWY